MTDIYQSKSQRRAARRAEWEQQMARENDARREAEAERERRFDNLVEAIDAFVSAKIHFERRMTTDPEWADLRDVNEQREYLTRQLAELLEVR